MVPNDDDSRQLENFDPDQSLSIDTSTSLQCHASIHKSDTFDSQTELAELARDVEVVESPKHERYSSPLFLELLGQPIEPIKILRSPLTSEEPAKRISSPSIPEDKSINNLLHTASLVSKTRKTPEVEIIEELTTTNNTNNDELSEEAIDDDLLKQFSVAEKRPSVNDPEQVLMKNVVPGKDIVFDFDIVREN